MKTDFKNFYEPESSGISSSVWIELTGDSGLGSTFKVLRERLGSTIFWSRQEVAECSSRDFFANFFGLFGAAAVDCEELFTILIELSDLTGDFKGLAWDEDEETGGEAKLLE